MLFRTYLELTIISASLWKVTLKLRVPYGKEDPLRVRAAHLETGSELSKQKRLTLSRARLGELISRKL
jgi:hypothetical protein